MVITGNPVITFLLFKKSGKTNLSMRRSSLDGNHFNAKKIVWKK